MIGIKINNIPKRLNRRVANTAAQSLVKTTREIIRKKGEAYLLSLFYDDGTQGVHRLLELLTSDLEERRVVDAISELYEFFEVILVPFDKSATSEPLYIKVKSPRKYEIDTHNQDAEHIILCMLCALRSDDLVSCELVNYQVLGGLTPVPPRLSENAIAFLKQQSDNYF